MRGPPGHRPPPTTPTPADPWQFSGLTSRRDSDASSRPSSVYSAASNHRPSLLPNIDRSHAVSTINSYLSSYSIPIVLKLKPLPSNKDLTETLKFVLTRLDFQIGNKIEDDVFLVMKCLNCPIKMNKSALKAPGTPHSFPIVLAVLHWLVQIAEYSDSAGNSTPTQLVHGDSLFPYTMNCYLHYISGDDDAIERLDEDFMGKMKYEKDALLEKVDVLSATANDLEAKLEALKSEPPLMEAKEAVKSDLEENVKKFYKIIEKLKENEGAVDKQMEAKEKELMIKMEERDRICEENQELKKKVEEQGINMRDAERIKRELQSVERDIGDADIERNKWEEKCWDVNSVIGTKFKEFEGLQTDCNQAIRRIKLGNDIHYELNANGTTPVEVLGLDYKTRLEPVLGSFRDEVNRSSMENYETLMVLKQQSIDIAAKIDAKRNRNSVLECRIDEVQNQIALIKNEIQEYTSVCATEATLLVDNFEVESRKIDLAEKDVHGFVQTWKAKLQETITQCNEDVQMCAQELWDLIDSVSKHKEFNSSKISEMNKAVSETASAVAQIHKDALTSSLGSQERVL